MLGEKNIRFPKEGRNRQKYGIEGKNIKNKKNEIIQEKLYCKGKARFFYF